MLVSRQHIKQLISLSYITFHVAMVRCILAKSGGGWIPELITQGEGGEGGRTEEVNN